MATHNPVLETVCDRMSSGGMPFLPFRSSVHLSETEARGLMREMLSGSMDTTGITEVLHYLRHKGETVAELVGFAGAMREMGEPVDLDQSANPVLDTCGTGGDGTNTFNISTATAFVVAGAGLRVAKHGNRRISSQCGSADVLEALNVHVSLSAGDVVECIRQTGIGFLFAPLLHPAVKYAQEARLQLKGRTVFNLLGPLTNPVRARMQLIGAFSIRAAEILAQASARLGAERAYVVHGADGLDEISISASTTVFLVEDGKVQKGSWSPLDFGVQPVSLDHLQGGTPQQNAQIVRDILEGQAGPKRDVVLVNSAAALLLAHKAGDVREAMAIARHSIDSGAAKQKLAELANFTSEIPR